MASPPPPPPIITLYVHNGLIVNQNGRYSNVEINLNEYKKISNTFTTFDGRVKFKSQQQYKGVNIFGSTLVMEQNNDDSTKLDPISGKYSETSTIANDINDNVKALISADDALQIAVTHYIENGDKTSLFGYSYGESEKSTNIELTLYYMNKYHLSYIVQFSYEDITTQNVYRPFVVIDAKQGNILYTFNTMINQKAWGTGGNQKIGHIRHGPLQITAQANIDEPEIRNQDVEVFDYISDTNQKIAHCEYETKTGTCEIQDYMINTAPNCLADAYKYGNVVFNLYREWGPPDVLPLAPELMPLRFYVHYGTKYENAFWTGSAMYFGDGESIFYPLVGLDVASHEVAHGFTDQGSNLIYSGQSGGINEAYSDLAGVAGIAYDRGEAAVDWQVGTDIFKGGPTAALRYLHNPALDGSSIDHIDDYFNGMNVHYSSGIYNKGWFNLYNNFDWSVREIFLMASHANLYYWQPSTTFSEGLCEMQTAACDVFEENECESRSNDIALAWQDQGIYCVANIMNSKMRADNTNTGTKHDGNHAIFGNNDVLYYIYGAIAAVLFIIFAIMAGLYYCCKKSKILINEVHSVHSVDDFYGSMVTDEEKQ